MPFVKLMNKIEKRRGWSGQADTAAASPAHRPHAENCMKVSSSDSPFGVARKSQRRRRAGHL